PYSLLATSSGSLPRTSYSFQAPSTLHYATAWVWHELPTHKDFHIFVSALGGAVTGPTVRVPPKEWTPVGASFVGTGESSGSGVQVRMLNSVEGEQFFVGPLQIEEKP